MRAFRWLFLAVLPGMTGCSTCREAVMVSAPYTRVTATDLRGRVIAEYLAEGPVAQGCESFKFVALERTIFHPCRMTFCYPLGRPVTVKTPNIIAEPVYSLEARSLASR